MLLHKNDFINELHSYLKDDLQQVNVIIRQCSHTDEALIGIISDHLINSGGKRIRPILTILSAKLFSYDGLAHLDLAAAVEFIHAATLLHDDVVDESKMRRSHLTANNIWGNKASILVGDFLFSQSFQLMVQANSMEALQILSQASANIAKGEVMQLSHIGEAINIETYYKIIGAKTAELFAASSSVGAIIANANHDEISIMKEYGYKLGLIFQIVDDLLDYFSSAEVMGKNCGDDFMEGKFTLPVILAMKEADQEELDFWQRTFIHHTIQEGDLEHAVAIMNKYDVKNQIMTEIIQLKQEITLCLDKLNINNKNYELLKELTDFVINRAY